MPTVYNQDRNSRLKGSNFYDPSNFVGGSNVGARFGLPNMSGTSAAPTGGAGLDRANIDSLLRGEFDPYEINMESAERAIGSGTGGSGFAQAGRYKLLDSEKLARKRMGNEMLDPYLNREHQAAMQRESLAAQAELAKSEAQWAMERLQASEAGLSARLSAQEKAELERLILRGEQAMDLERLNQEGQRDNTMLGGAFSLLGRMGASGGGGSPGSTGPVRGGYSTHGFSGPGAANAWAGSLAGSGFMNPSSAGGYMMEGQDPVRPPALGGGGSDRNVSSLISNILSKYGFKGFNF